jgi:hypothetical protein
MMKAGTKKRATAVRAQSEYANHTQNKDGRSLRNVDGYSEEADINGWKLIRF